MAETKYENRCYNGKGVHIELYKKLMDGKSYRGSLLLPKPYELKLLTEFIFGVKIGLNVSGSHSYKVYDQLNLKNIQIARDYNLAMLTGDIGIVGKARYGHKYMELATTMYMADVRHDDYYDGPFNRTIYSSCYEVDAAFWKTCMGELYCGGIGGYSYGQTYVDTFEERHRLLKFESDFNGEPRPEFIEEINKLKKENKKYIYNDLKLKLKNHTI